VSSQIKKSEVVKRWLPNISLLFTIFGAMGLCWFGRSLVQVVNVFMLSLDLLGQDDLFPKIHQATFFLALFVVGTVSSLILNIKHKSRQTTSKVSWSQIGFGWSLTMGASILLFSILEFRHKFIMLGSKVTAPTTEDFEAIIRSAEWKMSIAYLILALGIVFLIKAVNTKLEETGTTGTKLSLPQSGAVAMSLLLGMVSLVGVLFIRNHSNVLFEYSLGETLAKPGDLFAEVSSNLMWSGNIFFSIVCLGLIQMIMACWPIQRIDSDG